MKVLNSYLIFSSLLQISFKNLSLFKAICEITAIFTLKVWKCFFSLNQFNTSIGFVLTQTIFRDFFIRAIHIIFWSVLHVHGYMGTWVHGYMGTWVHAYMRTCVHAYMRTDKYTLWKSYVSIGRPRTNWYHSGSWAIFCGPSVALRPSGGN